MHGYLSSFNCIIQIHIVAESNQGNVHHQSSLERNIHLRWERHPFSLLIMLCNAISVSASPVDDLQHAPEHLCSAKDGPR